MIWILLLSIIQIHPCDEPELLKAEVRFNQNLTVFWCSLKADNIEAATLYIEGTAMTHDSVRQLTEENSTGFVQYSSYIGRIPIGKYTVILTVWNKDGQSPPSQPFEITVVRK